MKSLSRTRILIVASAFLIMTAPVRADIVTMKNGDKHEGKILSETPDSIEMEYKITPKIKDVKTFMKADIADIKRQTASEVEFAERGFAKLLPTPDLLTAADYETLIQDKLVTFAAKYPGTPETAQAEKIIKELAAEKSKVLSGQLKVEGRWLDAATVKRDTYNIDGYRLLLQMRQKARENTDTRYLEAMRTFQKLRTDFGASTYYVPAVPEALDILKKFETQLNAMLVDAPILLKQRQDGLKALDPSEGGVTKRSIEAEERAYKAALAAQVKAKEKWHDLYKYDAKGIQEVLAVVAKERAELSTLDLTAVQAENDSLLAMIRFMADGNLAEADTIFQKLSHQPNSLNKQLVQNLGRDLAAKKLAAKKVKPGSPTSSLAPATVEPSADAPNPVAEAMKKIQEEKEKKAAEAAKKGGKEPATPPTASTTAEKKPGAAKPGAAPAKPASDVSPRPERSLMETITDYVPFIGGGLLAVLLAALFFSKRKKKDDA